jgi:hypothetical protein
MRIIARLPPQTAEQVEYLTAATGTTVSHVVREAIAVYHAQVRGARKGGGSKFLALVGTGDSGHTDTASNYKALFAQYLDEKFVRSQRPPPEARKTPPLEARKTPPPEARRAPLRKPARSRAA